MQQHENCSSSLQQLLFRQLPLLTAVPPAKDLRLLLDSLDLSRVAFTADPVCCNRQLQQHLLQTLGVPHLLQPLPTAATSIIMAVQPASATSAISAALALHPAFIACYLPSEQLQAHAAVCATAKAADRQLDQYVQFLGLPPRVMET
jgi:hypothetical protein